jgi:hypothetical protein
MPLEARNVGDLQEKPLPRCVFETGFVDTQFHGAAWVNENFGHIGLPTSPNLSVNALPKVHNPRPDNGTPAEIAETMLRGVKWERGNVIGENRVANEAAGGMCVQCNHKEEGQVMGVPKCLKALLADLMVRGRIHKKETQQHKVAGDTSWLCVMDLQCCLLAYLCRISNDRQLQFSIQQNVYCTHGCVRH